VGGGTSAATAAPPKKIFMAENSGKFFISIRAKASMMAFEQVLFTQKKFFKVQILVVCNMEEKPWKTCQMNLNTLWSAD
jgi:hypothetical protein